MSRQWPKIFNKASNLQSKSPAKLQKSIIHADRQKRKDGDKLEDKIRVGRRSRQKGCVVIVINMQTFKERTSSKTATML